MKYAKWKATGIFFFFSRNRIFEWFQYQGKPGVRVKNLTQLHFLLIHFSKQNALFYRGTYQRGWWYSVFRFRKKSNSSLISTGCWIDCKPRGWSEPHQSCSPVPSRAIYIVSQWDTHLKQHNIWNKSFSEKSDLLKTWPKWNPCFAPTISIPLTWKDVSLQMTFNFHPVFSLAHPTVPPLQAKVKHHNHTTISYLLYPLNNAWKCI